ncbi:hypothetical protein B0H13DRAFT_2435230 [Mycena leptocephala]|nr:hypothetical protein B0H13DRAFT_2435230 [Mycena leptocephala]
MAFFRRPVALSPQSFLLFPLTDLVADSSPYSTAKQSRAVTFVLGGSTIRASKRLSHACGVGPGPCFALLGQGHALVSTQIRPPSLKTTASPMPPPSVRRLLVSLDFHKIALIGAAAELQDICGQRGEAAVGCYPPGLSAIFLPPVALLFFFRRVALPSPQRCVLAASARTPALSMLSPLLYIAATHANGSLKSRETTVSRHQILSALFQDHRVPDAAYVARPPQPCLPTPSCVSPVRERPLRGSPARSLAIGVPYELWCIEGGWGRRPVAGALPPSHVNARPQPTCINGVNSISSSAFGSCVLEPGQSRSENSPEVPVSFHTTAVPPLHCHHSGSFRPPASSLDRSSVITSAPAQRRSPTARSSALRHRIRHVARPQAYTAIRTATPPPQYAPPPAKASYAACTTSRTTRIWASRSLPSSSARGHARGAQITRRRSTATECTAAAGRDSAFLVCPAAATNNARLQSRSRNGTSPPLTASAAAIAIGHVFSGRAAPVPSLRQDCLRLYSYLTCSLSATAAHTRRDGPGSNE